MQIDDRYWAGIFDGEGTIYFAKDLKCFKISVAQKEPEILYLMQIRFGGNVTKDKNRTIHRWNISGALRLRNFLDAVLPFLIVKAVEGRIAKEILEGIRPNGFGMFPMKPEERERRQKLRDAMMADRADPKMCDGLPLP